MSDTSANDSSRCEATTVSGQRCSRHASRGRFCPVHDPERPQNMREVGRLGGLRAPMTKLRKATRADDELRERARQVLADAMDGKTVDREQLAAAKSLFSYRPNASPLGEQGRVHEGSGKIIVLADLVRVAVEAGMVASTCGCPVVVDGHEVRREDPTLTRAQREAGEPPVAEHAPETPEQALAQLVDAEAPKFDDSAEAKLTRRFGAEPDVVSWPQP